jgi:outer membrane protein assembly factor BamD (BamD/ComL family)
MEKAKEYFEMVSKESGRSLFSPMAKNYVNAIVEYQKTNKDLEIHMQMDRSESEINNDEAIDSTKLFVSQKERPSRTVPELYYQLADLEAFTFNRYDESKVLFDKIINEHPESMFNSKSMFALVFVHYSLKDSTSALKVKNELLNLFPDSDYALYLSDDSTATANEPRGQKKIFMQAESQITHNPSNAIKLFKSTIKLDAKTEYSVSAAYAIGYFYDQEAIIDSALKYYGWLKKNHPNTEQSIQANERMNSINFALSTVIPDSTESDIKE